MQKVWSAPGKVFLLGEYSVLFGGSALVAALAPRFQMSNQALSGFQDWIAHPQSPAARLFPHLGSPLYFRDPWQGAGGFGASTAQVILREFAENQRISDPGVLRELWQRYRSLSEGLAPSGADLIVQALGGWVHFTPEPFQIRPMGGIFEGLTSRLEIRVLQASQQVGRKVATHEHLRSISVSPQVVSKLEPLVEKGLRALEEADAAGFGRVLSLYGDQLAEFDLEDGATRRDKKRLSTLPGVLGVKGTGALQADALIVAVDPMGRDAELWDATIRELGLIDRGALSSHEGPAL